MATHDYDIANGTGAAVRADLNNALAAIVSNNSSASEPAVKYAYQWWVDTTDNVLKMRNSANNGWITLQELDGTLLLENGTEGAPSISFRDDRDTGLFKPGGNVLAISAGGNERIRFGSAEVAVNEGSDDVDFRVESNNNQHALFVDGGTDCVGIGVSTPGSFNSKAETLVLAKAGDHVGITLDCDTDKEGSIYFADGSSGDNLLRGQIVYNHSGDSLRFATNASERARLDSSGRLLLGLTSGRANFFNASDAPQLQLEATSFVGSALSVVRNANSSAAGGIVIGKTRGTAVGSNTVVQNADSLGQVSFQGADGSEMVEAAKIAANIDGTPGANDMPGRLVFMTSNDGASSASEKLRITQNGRVGIGTTSAVTSLDVSGDGIFGNKSSGNAEGGQITLRAKNGSTGLANFDVDGADDIRLFTTTDNTNFKIGQLSGTGSQILFYTGGSERSRVDGAGNIYIHQSTTDTPGAGNTTLGASFENLGGASGDGTALFVSRSGNYAASFNRAQDGTIININSAGNTEGTISISGSTTSYNGAHLSRWSQLAGNAERIEILRGSVLSNLDEMCEWGEEDNEQLNRMKVSDVEGDVNVAGVFQAWDDDDDTYTNDFYCAMTGDFVIRIAQGTAVARGDLLMSAGDGTAKPQDDDIVRSKTVAKVTSTTVSTTYADGSYCVPCVLMAC